MGELIALQSPYSHTVCRKIDLRTSVFRTGSCGLVRGWGEAAMQWLVEHQYACAQPDYVYEWADADEWNAILPP